MQPESMYEIELKALLSKEKYDELKERLPQELTQFNAETFHTTRYFPPGYTKGDIRLRYSDKSAEVVCKDGDAATIARKEVRIPMTRAELAHYEEMFKLLHFENHPPWIKHKEEFIMPWEGHEYILCLQHIENFAYILEIETMSHTDTSAIHEPNLRAIAAHFGCEAINAVEFRERIKEYIATQSVKEME